MRASGKIIAVGSGYPVFKDKTLPFHRYLLEESKQPKPHIGFLPTASGDSEDYIKAFDETYSELNCIPETLRLFKREVLHLEEWFERQDIIVIGGGNTLSMLAVWEAHGVNKMLKKFWQSGKVLAGGSAGAICWFEGGITDSFCDYQLEPLRKGLGLLSGSLCPHYKNPLRDTAYKKAIENNHLPAGFAVDDFAAVVFHGKTLYEAISFREGDRVQYLNQKNGVVSKKDIAVRSIL